VPSLQATLRNRPKKRRRCKRTLKFGRKSAVALSDVKNSVEKVPSLQATLSNRSEKYRRWQRTLKFGRKASVAASDAKQSVGKVPSPTANVKRRPKGSRRCGRRPAAGSFLYVQNLLQIVPSGGVAWIFYTKMPLTIQIMVRQRPLWYQIYIFCAPKKFDG